MPYYIANHDPPATNEKMWDILEKVQEFIEIDLRRYHFETREEAIQNIFGKYENFSEAITNLDGVARYRESDDQENLDYFFEKAIAALEPTKVAIDNRQLDANFLYYWTQLVGCHGFICSAMMALGNDMQSKRAGRASAAATNLDAQRIWFSHVFLNVKRPKTKREITDQKMVRIIRGIVKKGTFPNSNFGHEWYSKMLVDKRSGHFELTSSFQQRGLSEKKMARLVQNKKIPIPSTKIPS